MKQELVYLAVPYSHNDPDVREQRFKIANKIAAKLMAKGEYVFSPISHTHPIALAGDLPKGWDFWEGFDRTYLAMSKRLVVVAIDGWQDSVGVQGEIAIAKKNGIHIQLCDENGEVFTEYFFNDNKNEFQKLMTEELQRARNKHRNMNSAHEAYAVIFEELDEFWEEVRKDGLDKNALKELVQVAVMCQRAAEDLELL